MKNTNKKLLDNFLNEQEKIIEKTKTAITKLITDIKKYDICKNKRKKETLGEKSKEYFFKTVKAMQKAIRDFNDINLQEVGKLSTYFNMIEEQLSERSLIKAEDYLDRNGSIDNSLPGYEKYWEENKDDPGWWGRKKFQGI